MSKRKLNRRQKWRIEKIQAEKVARANKLDKKLSEDYQASDLGEEQTGLVIAHYGQLLDIEPLTEGADKTIHRCHVRANVDALVTGDVVVWRPGSNQSGVIETRLERKSLLQRPDNYGLLKPVAANIDRILIVVATEPTPHANLIDRYLVAAETLNIKPALLFNKSDLITDENRDEIHQLCQTYEDLGYEVLKTSAYEVAHCEGELLDWLKHHTSVFVGQSGVGKSSLIRSILGDQTIKVGALSELSRKGTHTTTTAKLFHIPGGGQLVDSPGIREFGLWHINESELLEGFIELRPHIGYCRFRDCKHKSEPKCAILDAVEKGEISAARIASYRRILDTLNDKETFEA
ncbi:MAG: small ribosomal subunit biogenesis GTPase RsgA [Oleiphilus sp.]